METKTLKENLIDVMKPLITELNAASEAYYSGKQELMSDKEWNDKFDELTALEKETGVILPDSPTANVSTSSASSKLPKVKHEYPALSLAKTKSIQELVKWADNRPINMSWKLDGLTLVATYDDGKLSKLVTRGDGTIGSLITSLAPAISSVLLEIPCKDHIVIRGEAVISYSDFNEFLENSDEVYENPRNLAAGTLNISKGTLEENLKKIRERKIQWIPFTPVYLGSRDDELDSWGARMEYLKELGFNTVDDYYIENPDEENVRAAVEMFTEWMKAEGKKKMMDIPVDGLVICYDDWKYSLTGSITGHHATRAGYAFKWQDKAVKTKLVDIEWSTAKNFITPIAIFEPVRIEGTTVTRASLCNISECKRLGIGEGSEIEVIKANKIIPKVVKATPGVLTIPDHCPVCGSKTVIKKDNDSEMLVCLNPECCGKELSKFATFVSKHGANIDGMSKATIKFLMEKGWLTYFSDFFYLKYRRDEWIKCDGFGEKSVDALLKAIENSREITLDRFIYSLSIPLIGRSASKDIAKAAGGDYFKFMDMIAKDKAEAFKNIDGIGDVMMASMNDYISSKLAYVITLAKEFNFIVPETVQKADLAGKTFVITGSLNHYSNRDELKDIIEDAGGKVTGSVSGKTTALINNDIESTSGKNKKAKELGVQIITEDEFISRYLN